MRVSSATRDPPLQDRGGLIWLMWTSLEYWETIVTIQSFFSFFSHCYSFLQSTNSFSLHILPFFSWTLFTLLCTLWCLSGCFCIPSFQQTKSSRLAPTYIIFLKNSDTTQVLLLIWYK